MYRSNKRLKVWRSSQKVAENVFSNFDISFSELDSSSEHEPEKALNGSISRMDSSDSSCSNNLDESFVNDALASPGNTDCSSGSYSADSTFDSSATTSTVIPRL